MRYLVTSTLILLAACEARVGKDKNQEAAPENEVAAATEPEQFALKLPGFEMKVDLPNEGVRTGEDSDMLYPGSRMTGMNIDAAGGTREETVELRFRTTDNIRKVVAWYRDPARTSAFSLSKVDEQDGGYRLAGTQRDGEGSFDLSLDPSGGGTEGRLVFSDPS